METLLQILLALVGFMVLLAGFAITTLLNALRAAPHQDEQGQPADEHEGFPGDVAGAHPDTALHCVSQFGPVCCDRTRCQMTGVCIAEEDRQS